MTASGQSLAALWRHLRIRPQPCRRGAAGRSLSGVFRGDPGERDAGLDSELLESVAAVSAGGVREVEPLGDLSVGLAASTAERLISAAGFAPVKAGGLNGKLLTVGRARARLAGAPLS